MFSHYFPLLLPFEVYWGFWGIIQLILLMSWTFFFLMASLHSAWFWRSMREYLTWAGRLIFSLAPKSASWEYPGAWELCGMEHSFSVSIYGWAGKWDLEPCGEKLLHAWWSFLFLWRVFSQEQRELGQGWGTTLPWHSSAGEAQNSLDMELRVSPPCEEGTDSQENSWPFHDSRENSISLWFWGKKNKLKLGWSKLKEGNLR